MPFSKRQMLTGASVVWLAALTILGVIALHQANHYAIPISHLQAAFTIALPPIAGIALETIISFQREWAARGELHSSRLFQGVTAAILIYETALATLAGNALGPDRAVFCALQDAWLAMWRDRDAKSIARIQDALQCCGFNSPVDMAFPLQDKTHGADACIVRYDRHNRCLEPWRGIEKRVAVLLMLIPAGVFAWKLILFLAPGFSDPWLPSAIRLPGDRQRGSVREQPAIEYGSAEPVDDNSSIAAETERLNAESAMASRVERARIHPSNLYSDQDNNAWK